MKVTVTYFSYNDEWSGEDFITLGYTEEEACQKMVALLNATRRKDLDDMAFAREAFTLGEVYRHARIGTDSIIIP